MASSNLLWNFAGHLDFRVRNLVISPQKDLRRRLWGLGTHYTTQVRAVVTSWQVVFSLSLSPRYPKFLLEVKRHRTALFTPPKQEQIFLTRNRKNYFHILILFSEHVQVEAWRPHFLLTPWFSTTCNATGRRTIFFSQPPHSWSVKDNFLVPSGITAQASSCSSSLLSSQDPQNITSSVISRLSVFN